MENAFWAWRRLLLSLRGGRPFSVFACPELPQSAHLSPKMPQMRILAQQSGGRRQKVWLSVKSKCGNWHKVVLFEV